MMPRQFPLSIPNECKPHLLALLGRVHQENLDNAGTLKKSKNFLKNIASDIGIVKSVDMEAKWHRCIAATDQKKLFTVVDYWNHLVHEALHFKLLSLDAHLHPLSNHAALQREIVTALTNNLFAQFEQEPNLDTCVKCLFAALPEGSIKLVYWKRINTNPFRIRVKDNWSAYHRLIGVSCRYHHLLQMGLFYGVGLKDGDFTNAFFKPSRVSAPNPVILNLPHELWAHIGSYLYGNDAHQFRQTSRTFFNIVENTTLRIRHRLFIVSKNTLLTEWIGRPVFVDDDYLVSETTYLRPTRCRVTHLKSPNETYHFFGDSEGSVFSRLLGANVCKDQHNKFIFLAAYGGALNYVTINQLRVASLGDQHATFRHIKINHEPLDRINWGRHAFFSVNGRKVTVTIQFEEYQENNARNKQEHVKTGVVENHVATFKMTDEPMKVVRAKRV